MSRSIVRPLNEKLITKVLKHIQEDPNRFKQDTSIDYLEVGTTNKEVGRKIPACRTMACFGGWAGILSAPKEKRLKLTKAEVMGDIDILILARKNLGLSKQEADYLFHTTGTGKPKEDLVIIKRRLANIRRMRILKVAWKDALETKNRLNKAMCVLAVELKGINKDGYSLGEIADSYSNFMVRI